ncbi:MAG TPA: tetratricopeptide repeat protein, partial [Gemmatimonadales bacterium]|nr:tetratricopeptide repeat protein [Gemmatimonadales bacterium]
GQLARAAQYERDAQADAEGRGLPADYIEAALAMGWMDLRYRNRPEDALQKVAAALARHPLTGMAPAARPYADLAGFYAYAGRVNEAQRLMAEFERVVPEGLRRGTFGRHWAAAQIAAAQGRSAEAVAELTALRRESGCATCVLLDIGRLYEKLGQRDSALAAYELVVTRSGPYRIWDDSYELAPVYRLLGELYEAKGERARALDYYGRFVDLWKNADSELQPAVRDVRQRQARLGAAR